MSTDATALHERAIRVLPGGVTAGARANAALGHPFYVSRADGPFVYDQNGRRLIDLCMSNGATLLGHGHPAVADAVRRALELGIACAYDGEPQVRLAERLVAQIPSFELVRFTGSGTEASQYLVRIARRYRPQANTQVRGEFPRLQRCALLQLLADPGRCRGVRIACDPSGNVRPAARGCQGDSGAAV